MQIPYFVAGDFVVVENKASLLRVHYLTLTVSNVARARAYIESVFDVIGVESNGDKLVIFDLGSLRLVLCHVETLVDEFGVSANERDSLQVKSLLSRNLASAEEVDLLTERSVGAGAFVLRKPQRTSWGGYSSLIRDPDHHLWEFVWNPGK